MMQKSLSNSSQESIGEDHPSQYTYVEREKCPYIFELDYNQKDLIFGWSFRQTPFNKAASQRHILLLFTSVQDTSPIELVKQYYKSMCLGNFLRVVNFRQKMVTEWIERTNSDHLPKFEEELNKKQGFSNEADALLFAAKQSKRYQQHTEMSIVVFPKATFPTDVVNNLDSLLTKIHYQGHLSLILPEALKPQLGESVESMQSSHLVEFYETMISLEVRCMRSLFYQLIKLRAKSVVITLKSLNADISITKHTNSLWAATGQPNTFVRKHSNLNNYSEYIERLRLAAIGVQLADFHIQFKTTELDGQEVIMETTFTIRIGASESMKATPPESKAASKMRQTCSGGRNGVGKNVEMHTQQLTIRPRLSGASCPQE